MGRVGAGRCGAAAGDEAGVSGDFAVPSAFDRIIVEGFRVGELILELGQELGAGLVVVAVLADVGVGAGFGGEVAGAVAVRNSGLDHFAVQPGDPVGDD